MKKLFISLGLAAIMFAPSCSTDFAENDTLLNGADNGIVEGVVEEAAGFITVGIDNTDTRLSVGEEAEGRIPLYWNTGDKLVINRTIETLAISEEYNGKNVATFGLSEANLAKVTYPITLMYPASVSTNSDKHFYIPTEQAYLQGHLSNGYGILMGKAENEGDAVNLQHMCGYLKVSLTGSTTVKKVMLRTAGHEPLSGFFKHNGTATEIGMTSYTASGLADGYYNSPVISIDSAEGIVLSGEATDFYFAIPAGEYSKGFVLHVLDSNNKQHRVKAYSTGKTIEAGVMIKMPALSVNCEKNWGIYDGNELVSFGRTLDKNAWLGVGEDTIYLRNDIDMQNEDLTDIPEDSYHRALIGFRADYKNDKIKVFEGKKSDTENYTIYNFRKTTDTDGGLLFARVPDYLTVQNVTLGKTIDDPTTDANEADSYVSLDLNETDYAYTSTFSYVVVGTVKNCVNNASVIGKATASNGLKVGTFSGSSDTSTGTIEGCINNGSIIIDAKNTVKTNYVGGFAALNYGTIKNCRNNGKIKISNASAETTNIGGIAGYTTSDCQTITCSNYGEVSAVSTASELRISGIVGCSKTSLSNSVNHGAVSSSTSSAKTYVGGVCAYNTTDAVELASCDNYGSVSISGSTSNAYVGGIVGGNNIGITQCNNYGTINSKNTNALYIGGISGYNLENNNKGIDNSINHESATITIDGNSDGTIKVGGVTGGSDSNSITSCTNNGAINVKNLTGGYHYVGGVFGPSGNKLYSCCNYGDITIDCPNGKMRVGGLGGYVTNTERAEGSTTYNTAECDITVKTAGTDSTIGGITGYSNNSKKLYVSYKGKITSNAQNSQVYVGGFAGTANGSSWYPAKLDVEMVNNGTASFALLVSGAVSSSNTYAFTAGSSKSSVSISKNSKFLGTPVTENAMSDKPESGKIHLVADKPFALTLTKTNLVYVD